MTIETTPFTQARRDIADLVESPVRAWISGPPVMRTDHLFQRLLTIPLDLAAAEYQVTCTQSGRGWYLEVERDLGPDLRLHLVGQARSYISALYQLADSAAGAIGRLERQARIAAENAEERETAA